MLVFGNKKSATAHITAAKPISNVGMNIPTNPAARTACEFLPDLMTETMTAASPNITDQMLIIHILSNDGMLFSFFLTALFYIFRVPKASEIRT